MITTEHFLKIKKKVKIFKYFILFNFQLKNVLWNIIINPSDLRTQCELLVEVPPPELAVLPGCDNACSLYAHAAGPPHHWASHVLVSPLH